MIPEFGVHSGNEKIQIQQMKNQISIFSENCAHFYISYRFLYFTSSFVLFACLLFCFVYLISLGRGWGTGGCGGGGGGGGGGGRSWRGVVMQSSKSNLYTHHSVAICCKHSLA